MYNIRDAIVTPWGDYEIAVRINKVTTGQLAGTITSSYEIFHAGRLLAVATVPAAFPTERDAAESALRIAKLDARESLEDLFPGC